MKFGLVIPTFPFDDSKSEEFVSQILTFLENSGSAFESVWTGDHLMPWTETMLSKPMIESFTAISHLSGVFRSLQFGNVVLSNSFRNPALLARMGATLQMLTGGRYILGIGAGWIEREYRAYGYPYPPTGVRLRQLEEAVQIIRQMWTEGTATFKGKYYQVENAICHPIPSPRPPIMIGGTGEKTTPRLVARYADWYNLPNISPEKYRHKLEILKEYCGRENRNFGEIRKTLLNLVAVSETKSKASEMVSKTPYSNTSAEENYLLGRPEVIAAKISKYVEMGVDLFMLRFLDFPKTEGVELFINQVIPALSNHNLHSRNL